MGVDTERLIFAQYASDIKETNKNLGKIAVFLENTSGQMGEIIERQEKLSRQQSEILKMFSNGIKTEIAKEVSSYVKVDINNNGHEIMKVIESHDKEDAKRFTATRLDLLKFIGLITAIINIIGFAVYKLVV